MRLFTAFLIPVFVMAIPTNTDAVEIRATGLDPTQVRVMNVTNAGTGCGSSSVSAILSYDLESLTLYFDILTLSLGPGTPVTERSKSCAIHISLSYPAGYQFGVLGTTYDGCASLDVDTTLTLQSTYYFSSSNLTSTDRVSITGDGDQAFTQSTTETNLIQSPCGTTASVLNINARMALTSTTATGTAQVPPNDAPDNSFVQQVQLAWQTCI